MAWWQQYPLTQAWTPPDEQGEDVATPFHTPLPPPFGGKVTRTRYGPFGGEVDIQAQVPNQKSPVTEYVLHLDDIFVHKGQAVSSSTILGLSGGQLSGGKHPAGSQYSSGPHTEVGFWTGDPWTSQSLDPSAILSGATGGGVGSTYNDTPAQQSTDVSTDFKLASLPIIGDITIPTDVFWKFGLIGLGSLLVLVGLIIMFKGPIASAGKAGAMVAAPEVVPAIAAMGSSDSGGGATWGTGGREVDASTPGENRSDTFIKGFATGAKKTQGGKPRVVANAS